MRMHSVRTMHSSQHLCSISVRAEGSRSGAVGATDDAGGLCARLDYTAPMRYRKAEYGVSARLSGALTGGYRGVLPSG